MPAPSDVIANRWDHPVLGMFAIALMMITLGITGLLLSGWRDSPEPLILAGVIMMLFSGFITLGVMAFVVRKPLARRGWPRTAAGGLRWAGVAAFLNLVGWLFALLAARARYS